MSVPESPPRADPPAEEEQRITDSTPAPTEPRRVVVPRWVQLVLLPLTVLALWALAKAAGKVILIFIVAGLIALILNPAVDLIQRPRIPRGLAVLAVYLTFFLALAGIGFLVANPISNQVRTFTNNLPHIVQEANKEIASFESWANRHGVHVKLVKQGKTALQSIQDKVAKSAGKIATFGGGLATEAANAIFDLVLIFVLSVYMLVYGRQIGGLARRVMPDGDGSRADDYPTLVQHAVARYIGGQLLFSTVMGVSTGLSLWLFGELGIFPAGSTYAVAFAVFYGVMELVPYVGPLLGALPPVVVALFNSPITAVWVVVLFIGLQLHGVVGALIALPILSILRETAVYLSRHLELEPWKPGSNGLL